MAKRDTVIKGNQIEDATVTETELNASVAGNGLAGGAGSPISVDLNELTGETVDVTADSLAIIDATDNSTKKETIVNFVTGIAGSGLTGTNGVISVNVITDNITEADFVKSVVIATEEQSVMPTFSGGNPVLASSVKVFLNGLLQEEGAGKDYVLSTGDGVVTFPSTPASSSLDEIQPLGDVNGNWYVGAMSSDATKIILGYPRLYISTNSGDTWAETQPAGAVNKPWENVDASADFSVLTACEQRLYISTDSGANWIERRPDGIDADRNWYFAKVSSDGTTILAGSTSDFGGGVGKLYISTDSGANFTETQPAGAVSLNWSAGAMTPNASILYAGTHSGAGLFKSINGGTSWTDISPVSYIYGLGCDSTGNKIIVGGDANRLYISLNGGTSFTEVQPAGDANGSWKVLGISPDGNTFIASDEGGWFVYKSTDDGANWEVLQHNAVNFEGCYTLDFTSDSSKMLIAEWGGRAYINTEVLASGGLDAGEIVTLQGILDN